MAAACNFGTPHDSSMRDRIICGIRNLTLLDELLKVYDLDLKECLCLCRVRELSKELKRATEAADSINAVQKQKQEGKPKRKQKIKCSYCIWQRMHHPSRLCVQKQQTKELEYASQLP